MYTVRAQTSHASAVASWPCGLLLAHVAAVLPAFHAYIVCFDLPARLREQPFALGVESLANGLGRAPNGPLCSSNLFPDRPGGLSLAHHNEKRLKARSAEKTSPG